MSLTDNSRLHVRFGTRHLKIARDWKVSFKHNPYWGRRPPETAFRWHRPTKPKRLNLDYVDIFLNLLIIFILVSQMLIWD